MRFAALVHDLGKGATPRAEWPSHRGHEERSVALIEALAARLRVPGRIPRTRPHRGPLPWHRASSLRAPAQDHTGIHGAGRRLSSPGALRSGAARLRGRCARTHRIGDQTLSAASIPAGSRRRGRIHQAISKDIASHPGAEIAELLRRRRVQAIAMLRERCAEPADSPRCDRPRVVEAGPHGLREGRAALRPRSTAPRYSACRSSRSPKPRSGTSKLRDHAIALKRSPISPGSISRRA